MFSAYLPRFERYYEPFFGGGGTFFALQPATKAFINDKSADLINFYRLHDSSSLRIELMKYADLWEATGHIAASLISSILPLYKSFIQGEIDQSSFYESVPNHIMKRYKKEKTLLDESFIVDRDKFLAMLIHSVQDKGKRLKKIASQREKDFDELELAAHIETAIKSGLYLFLRHLTNLNFAGSLQLSEAKAAANWYFVREFCYASMFRYSRKGNFNIPYGGIAYNKKNFRQKVENIFSDEVKSLFANASFYNLDFEDFLHVTGPSINDFIFLDPPYDSEFSEYDQNVFSKSDQQRLRDTLLKTAAKWMLVIKETDFIRSLYNSPECRFIEFDKKYTYNVRGRNNRETKHLIIVNY
ncbi:DNA adenine methylase [Segetibacter aerophilus]|uniref:site-specific DNA-methyltransferase (adenine-specific) n=2 Tax=Segetibacter aerophilus TaxID=670293 RepID=A0A512BB76_9BACT|nr:DNA adenine methylase [Segetibacter aerophilus]